MKIAVLGAGSWGTTVAVLACRKNDTILWSRRPELADEISWQHTSERYLPGFRLPNALRATADVEEAVTDADVVVVGVPTHGFRAVLEQARPYACPEAPIVSLAKGFEPDTLMRMTEVVAQAVPGHPAAVLTGPNIAKEVMAGYAAASVIAAQDQRIATGLQDVLRRGLFRIYRHHDVIGCEVAGALKNVIAIATGIAQGLSVGDNTRAAVITRGLNELTHLGTAMGGEPATFAGLAGLGDLVATCVSPHSRNRHVGEQLGLGRPLNEIVAGMTMVAEGIKAAVTVQHLADRHALHLPICNEIYRVIKGEISARHAYRGLRPAGHEAELG
jgi:glycerol-3-phosphate dehydrogenase (NAD(P)+)